ncbi:MAG: TraB/GumN family protein [Deltaproteobacteria bacterium]|jgi:uncharacterized protein YbaP (TraB family)|nr:TraB/GumN family protein [Deltaproteobacteria bacterium]
MHGRSDRARWVKTLPGQLFLLALALLWAVSAAPLALAENGKHFLWSVSDSNGPRLYIMGSIHMAREDLYPLAPVIEEAFGRATDLVVEVDTSSVDMVELAQKTFTSGIYKDGSTIWDHLDPETSELLKKCLKQTSLNSNAASIMRPWLLAMTMELEKLQSLGYDDKLGLDLHFIQKAKAKGLPVRELESAGEQIDAFIAFDEIDSVLLLRTTLLEFDQIRQQIEEIFGAWSSGDTAKFEEIIFDIYRKNPEVAPVLNKLIFDRTVKMFDRLKPIMVTGRLPFILVGASHLVGPQGLLADFEKAGYVVEQL